MEMYLEANKSWIWSSESTGVVFRRYLETAPQTISSSYTINQKWEASGLAQKFYVSFLKGMLIAEKNT